MAFIPSPYMAVMVGKDKHSILIIEDEELMRNILRQLLEDDGYRVFTSDSAENAFDILDSNEVAVTLTDIRLPGMDGLQLLRQLKAIDSNAIVIVMTAYSSVDSAISALRKGAFDYITKPFVNEDLLHTVRNAVRTGDLSRENRQLRRALDIRFGDDGIIGKSEALQSVLKIVDKVAATAATVLIQGESGTGKELFAKALHHRSTRSRAPFLALNCGAIPEDLLESELFGHKKGAFTGAHADKKGLFRSADGGTLLLDEIGEMPMSLQVKLLRALEEQAVTPVGASKPDQFDARIVSATNKDLESEVAAGRFREDLFYRLNVVEVNIPPLRDRREDIPLLTRHFVSTTASRQNGEIKQITGEAMTVLLGYGWPGNVRELRNAIERAYLLSGDEIDVSSLPPKIDDRTRPEFAAAAPGSGRPTLSELEKDYVMEVLRDAGNDKSAAALILGIDLSTLYRKLKRYNEL